MTDLSDIMLLVGDMHVTRRSVGESVSKTEQWVRSHSTTQSIIFLGDFVYHFSVDRVALREVFQMMLRLSRQGYSIYVLAGNHDRISSLYIFQEAQDLLQSLGNGAETGAIEFITSAQLREVDGVDVLFLPYTAQNYEGEKDVVSPLYSDMMDSSTIKERLSGYVNATFETLLSQRRARTQKSPKLHVIHHWYTEGHPFPGQFAAFTYRSAALDRKRLDEEDCILISGHLHKPFVFKNYLCCGSVWYTSPLERNQWKYLFEYDPKLHTIIGTQIAINPYLQVDFDSKSVLGSEHIETLTKKVTAEMTEVLTCSAFTTTLHHTPINFSTVTLNVRTPVLHAQLDEYVDDTILTMVKEVTIKQSSSRSLDEMMSSLQDASLRLGESIADWKTLLERYGERKFGEQWPTYCKELEELAIL